MALAEAITLGIPTIALDSIGNREYFNGSNFIFVKKPDDFVSQLESVFDINTRKLLNRVAKLSMAKYTSESMAQSFLKIISR
jgi:glycosyltransferase involved in cell wall biosynthesis